MGGAGVRPEEAGAASYSFKATTGGNQSSGNFRKT